MSVDTLLAHLEGIKRTGDGRWIARCPAHDDRHASMAVREADSGAVLVHCFAGCSVGEIIAACGLDMADLFPPRAIDHGKPERRPFPAADILRTVGFEAMIVAVCAVDLAKGRRLSDEDQQRLNLAATRLQAAVAMVR